MKNIKLWEKLTNDKKEKKKDSIDYVIIIIIIIIIMDSNSLNIWYILFNLNNKKSSGLGR